MSNKELYSPEGLRIDGRRWNEIRSFNCKLGTYSTSSDGSSYIQQGNTKVICKINGPIEPKSRASYNVNEAMITVNLTISSFSSIERRKRSKSDKRIKEMSTLLEKSFQQIVLTKLYPRTQIIVDCYVLSQDGGVLSTVGNSITLALIDAGIAMYDFINFINVGLFNKSTPLLDLNYLEEQDMSFLSLGVVGKSEKISMMMLEDKIPYDSLQQLLSIGISGSHRVKNLMDEELKRYGKQLISTSATN